MQALKPPAAVEWGLSAILTPLGPLSEGTSESCQPVSRAKKQPVGRRRTSRSVAPSRRNMQLLISSRLPLVGILLAYWPASLRRHSPATKRLAGCRQISKADGLNAFCRPSSFEPRSARATLLLYETRREPLIWTTGSHRAKLASRTGSVGFQWTIPSAPSDSIVSSSEGHFDVTAHPALAPGASASPAVAYPLNKTAWFLKKKIVKAQRIAL